MKLSKVFQSKGSALREAFQNDDLALMEKLLGKKSNFLIYDLFNAETCAPITPRMADLFVGWLAEGKAIRWSLGEEEKNVLLPAVLLVAHAIEAKNYPVLDVLLDGRLNYGERESAVPVINHLVKADLDAEKRVTYLKKQLAQSGKLHDQDKVVKDAVEAGNTDALDILAASGIDLHEKNEFWLREAAKMDKKHVCLHLVEKQGADLAHAQKTAQELGTHSVYVYLESLRDSLNIPTAEDAPPTVESLSREMKELRTTVRELTALVRDLQAERTIDKSVDKPGLRTTGNTP